MCRLWLLCAESLCSLMRCPKWLAIAHFDVCVLCSHVDSFADVNLEYLTSIHELETASSHDVLSFPGKAPSPDVPLPMSVLSLPDA